MQKQMYTKGSIVLVPFPFTNISGEKLRPALVLAWPKNEHDCVLAFMSSQKKHLNKESDVEIEKSSANFAQTGLKVSSFVKLSKIASIDKKLIVGKLGQLGAQEQKLVDEKLVRFLGLG